MFRLSNQIVFLELDAFPIAVFKLLGEQFHLLLLICVLRHARKGRVDLPTFVHFQIRRDRGYDQII